jgi:hypothetical protein
MTDKQETKVRKNAYKYYDEIVFENQDWSKRRISLSSFYAGADYVLKNKHELQEVTCLAEFLARKGALIEFMENVLKQRVGFPIEEISSALGDKISVAFAWGDTPQGFEYWRELAEEFETVKR